MILVDKDTHTVPTCPMHTPSNKLSWNSISYSLFPSTFEYDACTSSPRTTGKLVSSTHPQSNVAKLRAFSLSILDSSTLSFNLCLCSSPDGDITVVTVVYGPTTIQKFDNKQD